MRSSKRAKPRRTGLYVSLGVVAAIGVGLVFIPRGADPKHRKFTDYMQWICGAVVVRHVDIAKQIERSRRTKDPLQGPITVTNTEVDGQILKRFGGRDLANQPLQVDGDDYNKVREVAESIRASAPEVQKRCDTWREKVTDCMDVSDLAARQNCIHERGKTAIDSLGAYLRREIPR